MDAYQAMLQLRANLSEPVEVHWKDLELLNKLNYEYKRIWMQLAMQAGDWLATSASVTVTAGVITLPATCGKPLYLEDENNRIIPFAGTMRERRLYELPTAFGVGLYVSYVTRDSIVANNTALSGTWTLWFIKRFVPMIYGVAGASSGAAALHLEAAQQPSMADDTYNDLDVNTYTIATNAQVLADTITDYTGSTQIATVTGTPAATTDGYGTVLEQPEEADGLLIARTTLSALAKPSTSIDPKYFEYQNAVMRSMEQSWKDWIETRIPGSRQVRVTR